MTKGFFRAIGLMSGTSADGVSVAITEIKFSLDKPKLRLISYKTYKYPKELQDHILNLRRKSVNELCKINFYLGKVFADAVGRSIAHSGFKPSDIDVIGSHGQTICHAPKSNIPSTLQIGEPSVMAESTDITTVADFRCRDISAGGEGAPLIPYFDYVLFGGRKPIALQNIGGIANVTVVSRRKKDTLAFDTGPGNMLIDEAVRRLTKGRISYDKNGRLAEKGRVNIKLLNNMRSYSYFHRSPPKSCGREDFGEEFFNKYCTSLLKKTPYDLITTLTYFTAETIAFAYSKFAFRQFPTIREVIVSGGGALNPVLMRHLRGLLHFINVKSISEYGIHPLAKEPMAFALLAVETLRGIPNNIKSATGAKSDTILGKIIPGKNFSSLMRKIYK